MYVCLMPNKDYVMLRLIILSSLARYGDIFPPLHN